MIHHIYANRTNAGDWLSARGIQELLSPLAVEEHLCDEPFVPATLQALARATPDDFIIIGGGGLFMDYFTPFWEEFNAISQRVPFAIWGVGCCAVKRASSQPPWRLLQEIVARSRLCVVRDELTRSQLNCPSLPSIVPCPAFNAVRPATRPGSRRILHVDHYDHLGPEVFARVEEITHDFAGRSHRTTARTNNLIRAGSQEALRDLLDLYASADVVLSSRLHGCILALATGRHLVAISGDHKVDAFMHAAGLNPWVCGLDDVERIPMLLDRIDDQVLPEAFLARTRSANLAIARSIRSLVTEPARSSATAATDRTRQNVTG